MVPIISLPRLIPTKYKSDSGSVSAWIKESGFYSLVSNPISFSDTQGFWAKEEIEFLAAHNIIKGLGDGRYGVSQTITRADFMVLLMGVLEAKLRVDTSETVPFADVNSDKYYEASVSQARALGLTNGNGQNMFMPQSNISREDMMTMVDRSLLKIGLESEAIDSLSDYSDTWLIAEYAKNSVGRLVASGLINGANGQLNPQENLTRGEAARIIYMIWMKLYAK
jgi:endo-1,4-beta-xylanase